jgi:hypothetical protein
MAAGSKEALHIDAEAGFSPRWPFQLTYGATCKLQVPVLREARRKSFSFQSRSAEKRLSNQEKPIDLPTAPEFVPNGMVAVPSACNRRHPGDRGANQHGGANHECEDDSAAPGPRNSRFRIFECPVDTLLCFRLGQTGLCYYRLNEVSAIVRMHPGAAHAGDDDPCGLGSDIGVIDVGRFRRLVGTQQPIQLKCEERLCIGVCKRRYAGWKRACSRHRECQRGAHQDCYAPHQEAANPVTKLHFVARIRAARRPQGAGQVGTETQTAERCQ